MVNTLADTELKASIRCLGMWGRLLHYKREDMVAARTIGETTGECLLPRAQIK